MNLSVTGPAIHLFIHNILSVSSLIMVIGMSFFTFLNGRSKRPNVLFAIAMFFGTIFLASHLIGVNITDPNISRAVLMFNLSVIPLAAFQIHSIYAFVGKEKERKAVIIISYSVMAAMLVFFLVFPDTFLLPSVPKMYFPNYYNPGTLNFLRVVFLYGFVVPVGSYELWQAYRRAPTVLEKNQFKYFFWFMVIGYGLGFVPNFLVYNIPVDPLIGITCTTFGVIPFLYGAFQYQLFSIKVIAKQAFLYSGVVVLIGGIIVLFNYSNQWFLTHFSWYPFWVNPLISALLVVSIGFVIWENLRQSEILKYEFITTVTHKFRTPLTYIKWASENLIAGTLSPAEATEQLKFIQTANTKLVELTNILVNASDAENKNYGYKIEKSNLSDAVQEVMNSLADQMKAKKMTFNAHLEPNLFASFDPTRSKFVIQVLLENAMHYSPEGSVVTVTTYSKDKEEALCVVNDHGIGITKEQIPFLFTKFYRTYESRAADTEGMGIGLYISQQILANQKGKVWAQSEGSGKGSTFTISLPYA